MKSSKRIEYLRNNGTFSEVYSIDNPPPYPVTASGTYPNMTVGNATNAKVSESSYALKRKILLNRTIPLSNSSSWSVTTDADMFDEFVLYLRAGDADTSEIIQVPLHKCSQDSYPVVHFSGSGGAPLQMIAWFATTIFMRCLVMTSGNNYTFTIDKVFIASGSPNNSSENRYQITDDISGFDLIQVDVIKYEWSN